MNICAFIYQADKSFNKDIIINRLRQVISGDIIFNPTLGDSLELREENFVLHCNADEFMTISNEQLRLVVKTAWLDYKGEDTLYSIVGHKLTIYSPHVDLNKKPKLIQVLI